MVNVIPEVEHSRLGASGFARWSVCPGSVRQNRGLRSTTSIYSAAGTAAHWIAEKCLTGGQDAWEWVDTVVEVQVKAHKRGDPDLPPILHTISPSETDAVQVFLDAIQDDIRGYEAAGHHDQAIVWVEEQVSLAQLAEGDNGFPVAKEMFGTADCMVYFPAWELLRIYDYKHGKGIVVEVEGNGQLRYYGVGGVLYTIPSIVAQSASTIAYVEMVLVQPRAEHPDGPVRRERLSVQELEDWATDVLLPAADATTAADAPLVPGAYCGKTFCASKDSCPARLAIGNAMLEASVPDIAVAEMEDGLLAEKLDMIVVAEDYIKSLKAEAFSRLDRGQALPGWGLAQKKAHRQWKPEAEALKAAIDTFGETALEPPKMPVLRSPAQMEKLEGGKVFAKKWAFTPDTGLTLARTGTKRPIVERKDMQAELAAAVAATEA